MAEQEFEAPANQGAQTRDNVPVTMEQALQDAEARLEHHIRRGQVVTGTVVFVGNDGVAVDIGSKVEGIIPFDELTDEPHTPEELKELLHPGEQVEANVIYIDPETSTIKLSKKRAEGHQAWAMVNQAYESGKPVEVVIREHVRGGLVGYIKGLRAFLPASQLDLKRVAELEPFVGQTLKVKIIEVNRKKRRIVISRRALLEQEAEQKRQSVLSQLHPGDEVEGEVVEVPEFGAFVNLGGIDGLIHRSELTWGRFNHPQEVVKVGQKVRARVVSVDAARERVNLSIKALIPNPWTGATERYQVGQKVKGRVVGLTSFGAFVEVEPGLEGLVHISEMSWVKQPRHPSEILKEGDEVEVVILRIDPEERRFSLGLRETQPDPWKQLPERYPPGSVIKGRVSGVASFGIFVEVEPGFEGLVHVSELDYSRVEDPSTIAKKGDEIEVVVLQIDPVEQRISLSRKRLLPPPIPVKEEKPAGKTRKGSATAKSGRRRFREGEIEYGGERAEVGEGGYATYDRGGEPAGASVRLGDLFGDLLGGLSLEEEEVKGK